MADARNILIFANPISGMGQGVRIAQSLCSAARSAGHQVNEFFALPASAPESLFPDAANGIIVCIGGDGTLRSIVERLLATGRPIAPIVLIPLGTANLVAANLHCKWPPEQIGKAVLSAIAANQHRPMDVASVNGHAMLAVAGVGFDAQVVHDLCSRRRGPITYADYFLPTVRSIAGYQFPPISVTLDGVHLITNTPAIAFIGNIPEYGAGFSVTPMARADDGLLDLCLLPCNSWQDLFELGTICGMGMHVNHDRAIYRQGKHIEIVSAHRVPIQVDGDESGFLPAAVNLLPRQLTFIVPPVAI